MKVHINLSKEYTEPQITILAAEANEDIQKLLSYIQNMEKVIAANEGDSIIILNPEEIHAKSACIVAFIHGRIS